jgi:hypothetical protein
MMPNSAELDLHGVRHSDVDRLVENFIYLNQKEIPLTIICGNSNTMIQLARDVINRIGCSFVEPRFGIIVVTEI